MWYLGISENPLEAIRKILHGSIAGNIRKPLTSNIKQSNFKFKSWSRDHHNSTGCHNLLNRYIHMIQRIQYNPIEYDVLNDPCVFLGFY